MAQRYLLSIDSGGLRGIIPVATLIALEQTTGRLTRDIFSFVAGTSTGALIAASIAAGIPATQIMELYVVRARDLFQPRFWSRPQRIITGSKYSTEKLAAIIADSLGPARDWTLNDAPIDLLITAKGLTYGMPWYFVPNKPTNSGRTGHLGLVDVATASSAAPTYFVPWKLAEDPATLPADWEPIGPLVDGAVGVAGNPVYQACVEAFFYSDQYRPETTTVVSLGTGRFLEPSAPAWLWPWLQWLLNELLQSPGEQQTELVQRHFPGMRFYRIDPPLERAIGLDDVASIDYLQEVGTDLAGKIDWPAILDGTATEFRVSSTNTLSPQYSHQSSKPE